MEQKRIYRELDDATREKISAGLRNKMKSPDHRANISRSMKKYWSTIPSQYPDNDGLSPTEIGQII